MSLSKGIVLILILSLENARIVNTVLNNPNESRALFLDKNANNDDTLTSEYPISEEESTITTSKDSTNEGKTTIIKSNSSSISSQETTKTTDEELITNTKSSNVGCFSSSTTGAETTSTTEPATTTTEPTTTTTEQTTTITEPTTTIAESTTTTTESTPTTYEETPTTTEQSTTISTATTTSTNITTTKQQDSCEDLLGPLCLSMIYSCNEKAYQSQCQKTCGGCDSCSDSRYDCDYIKEYDYCFMDNIAQECKNTCGVCDVKCRDNMYPGVCEYMSKIDFNFCKSDFIAKACSKTCEKCEFECSDQASKEFCLGKAGYCGHHEYNVLNIICAKTCNSC
ncbi:uncharacterized protein [Lepeophtheirus salmonis]|uniref:uncharacterized protein isoform X2 n=1 Tax=Lepeophtheirus salmonis TaxID=72036 RepID=UPI001AE151D3|nr:integumentary mucin C.1-like isoform X2 [Lepeophtheirus salmonis]